MNLFVTIIKMVGLTKHDTWPLRAVEDPPVEGDALPNEAPSQL